MFKILLKGYIIHQKLSGDTVDFKLSHHNDYPIYATISRSGLNESVLEYWKKLDRPIKIVQIKYFNLSRNDIRQCLVLKLLEQHLLFYLDIEYMHISRKTRFEVKNQREAAFVFYVLIS